MTRTQDEIVARYKERRDGDYFGFEVDEYVNLMDYDHAKPYLKPEVTRDEWKPDTVDDVRKRMAEYIDFAYEKADGERGLSANRSIMHYIAWTWLVGDDDLCREITEMYDERYHDYGRPILQRLCEHYGWKPNR